MKDRAIVTVTLEVALDVDSGERLAGALRYVLAELDHKIESMRGETKLTAASARFEKKEVADAKQQQNPNPNS